MVTGSIPVTRSKIPSVSGRFLIYQGIERAVKKSCLWQVFRPRRDRNNVSCALRPAGVSERFPLPAPKYRPSTDGFLFIRESNGPLRKVACGKFSGHGVIETTLVALCAPQGFRSDSRYPLHTCIKGLIEISDL